MKKNDLLIAFGAIIFAVLFYQQAAGINFLIFSALFGALSYVFNRETLQKQWYFSYALHFLCAFNIFYIHTNLAVWAWLISLIYLVGKTFESTNSYIITTYFTMASTVTTFGRVFSKLFIVNKEKKKQSKLIYLGAILISFVLVLIFFFLYKGANPLFNDFTNNIDLSWLDIPFLLFCILSFLIVFTLIHPYFSASNSSWDKNKLQELKIEDEDQSSQGKIFVSLVAILVFTCLNLMLLSLNVLDIKSIFVVEKLPKDIFLADFLHFSVSAIVFSIILAIILIVIVQQFKIKNKFVKFFIYLWIFQSLIMVLDTFVRNYWYSYNQITYLRIGVFVFLSMCIFGLVYTAFSIFKKRNYWFLLNINMQTWFYVLILSSFFSWDRIITSHNLKFEKIEQIDIEYLNSLSENNLDLMLDFYEKHPEAFNLDSYSFWFGRNEVQDLKAKFYYFKFKMKYNTWQSYSIARANLNEYLEKTKTPTFIKESTTNK